MDKHTPGPWRIGNAGSAVFQATGIKLVADLARLENHKANAQLIAAAPELLAALRDLASKCHGDQMNEAARSAKNAAIYRAMEVIRKAEGAPQS